MGRAGLPLLPYSKYLRGVKFWRYGRHLHYVLKGICINVDRVFPSRGSYQSRRLCFLMMGEDSKAVIRVFPSRGCYQSRRLVYLVMGGDSGAMLIDKDTMPLSSLG